MLSVLLGLQGWMNEAQTPARRGPMTKRIMVVHVQVAKTVPVINVSKVKVA